MVMWKTIQKEYRFLRRHGTTKNYKIHPHERYKPIEKIR